MIPYYLVYFFIALKSLDETSSRIPGMPEKPTADAKSNTTQIHKPQEQPALLDDNLGCVRT